MGHSVSGAVTIGYSYPINEIVSLFYIIHRKSVPDK